MKTRRINLMIGIISVLILISVNIIAQDSIQKQNVAKEKKAFQFTFIYPMGTNGTNSPNCSNDISLNILGGFNGGVNACELGAFANINHGDVNGFQVAGFTNVNIGNTTGFQYAGFYNQNKEFNGGQIAGFLNTNVGNCAGLMGAGFANVVKGDMKGWQLAGFINTNTSKIEGAQLAGFTNIANGNVKGAQVAGFANVAKDINGAQLAGFINVAQKVKGAQLGFINIADSVDGASIGFLSIVKNGYHRIEFGANESLYANLTFKIGTNNFYNIFTSGLKFDHSKVYWSYGYGVGSVFAVHPKVNLNFDLFCQQINENQFHTENVNLLNTFRLNASYKLTDLIELVAGPSFNVFVSEFDHTEGIGSSNTFVPYSFYDQVHNNYSVKMYIGFNAAIRF